MKNLEEKKEELRQLNSQIAKIKLSYGYNEGFESKTNLRKFINENKEILEQANNLTKDIEKLEWELLTPEQKAKKTEQRRLSKLKREGKLF